MIKQDLMKFFIYTSKDIMKKSGHHTPQLFLVRGNEIVTMILPFDDNSKDEVIHKAREVFNNIKPDSYYFVSESWMVQTKPNEDYIRPRDNPKREECLIISEFKSDLSSRTCIVPIIRNDKIISFGRKREMKGVDSVNIWNFYLEEDGLNEHMDSSIREMVQKNLESEVIKIADKYKQKLSLAKDKSEYRKILIEMDSEIKQFVDKVKNKLKG